MANSKISILDFLGTAYDIDALYLGGVAADNFARRDANNSFTGKNTFSAGVQISGRYLGAGDDEGLVIGRAENSYAGICLGEPAGIRSVFYLKPDNIAIWRYNNGTSGFDIAHPGKGGTIALTSDIPTKLSQLTNDSGYTTNAGTVTQVKVGTTAYNPSSGVISLPAYPTSLPASDVYNWAKAATKPSYTASEIGLGNVGNFKAVSTVASQGLTNAEKSNARANIGAGTSSFTGYTASNKLSASYISGLATVATSGSYNDLNNKPTIPTAVTETTVSGWGFTKNSGNVTGSSLTANKFVVGNGNNAIKISTMQPTTSSTSWSTSSDVYVPTMKAISAYVTGLGYTKNAGTVTQVKVGSTAYNPSSGVVSLPAYPTVPTKTSQLTNDSNYMSESVVLEYIGDYDEDVQARLDAKVGCSDSSITEIKVVSSLPSNPSATTLYIIV